MAGKSEIEWTDATWNPVRGCVKVSPGCKHCYAETFAERWRGVPGHAYEQGFDPRLVPAALDAPLRWKKPQRIFVNSMSDLFGDFVPEEYLDRCMATMLLGFWHTYQVLTKRGERLAKYLRSVDTYARILRAATEIRNERPTLFGVGISKPVTFPAGWIHLGVSVEDRKYGLPRLDHLRRTPAAARFVSVEPLLEDLGEVDFSGIDQVIVGAESGHGARPMNEDWVRRVRDQAKRDGSAFFYKQRLDARGRKVSLPVLDGRQWAEMPT